MSSFAPPPAAAGSSASAAPSAADPAASADGSCAAASPRLPLAVEAASPYQPSQKGVLSVLCRDPLSVPSSLSPSEHDIQHVPGADPGEYMRSKRFILLYFSAAWCPPCRTFSPTLSGFAYEHRDKLGVIFLSHDTSPDEAARFSAGKFFAVPPFRTQGSQVLNQLLGVAMLPTLVVFDRESGKVLTNWGRAAVQYNGDRCVEDWEKGKSGVSWLKATCSIS